MALHVGMVTVDPVVPPSLAGFWTAAVDMKAVAGHGALHFTLKGAGDLIVGLQRVSESTAGKNRVHVDLSIKDRAARVARPRRTGADVADDYQVPGSARSVLSDPDGTVFCVGAQE